MHRAEVPARGLARAVWLTTLLPALAWAAAPATPTQSPARTRVVVLVAPQDAVAQAEAGRLEALADAALWRAGRFEPARLVELVDPANARWRAAHLQEAGEHARQGLQAYNDLDTQRAQALFERAIKAYELTDLTRTFEAYVQAWLMKLASQVANGQGRQAEKELERLLVIAPRAPLAPDYFPPDFISRAERVRRKLVAAPGDSLEIRTTPSGAEIHVDGQYRGRSPLTVTGLPPGEHLLSAVATGTALHQQRVRDGRVEIVLRPAEGSGSYQQALARIASDPRGRGRDDAAAQFGRTLEMEQVLLVVAKKSVAGERLDVIVIRLDAWDAHNYGYGEGTVSLTGGLSEQWEALLEPVLSRDAPRADGPVGHYQTGLVWTQRSSGFALFGAGLALAAGGTWFGVQALNAHRDFRATPQTDETTSGALRRKGQTYALVADILVLAGLVGAGSGGFLVATAEDRPAVPAGPGPSAAAPSRAPAASPGKTGPSEGPPQVEGARGADEPRRTGGERRRTEGRRGQPGDDSRSQ